jgi:hypothetical protein
VYGLPSASAPLRPPPHYPFFLLRLYRSHKR